MNRKCIFKNPNELNYNLSGTLIGWGVDFWLEYEAGGLPFTAGIIELPDGKVKLIRADDIQFLHENHATRNCSNCKSALNNIRQAPCNTCISTNWEAKP